MAKLYVIKVTSVAVKDNIAYPKDKTIVAYYGRSKWANPSVNYILQTCPFISRPEAKKVADALNNDNCHDNPELYKSTAVIECYSVN